jgi:hypothetical protein
VFRGTRVPVHLVAEVAAPPLLPAGPWWLA